MGNRKRGGGKGMKNTRKVGRSTFRLAPANEFVNKAIDIRICLSLFNRRINI